MDMANPRITRKDEEEGGKVRAKEEEKKEREIARGQLQPLTLLFKSSRTRDKQQLQRTRHITLQAFVQIRDQRCTLLSPASFHY